MHAITVFGDSSLFLMRMGEKLRSSLASLYARWDPSLMEAQVTHCAVCSCHTHSHTATQPQPQPHTHIHTCLSGRCASVSGSATRRTLPTEIRQVFAVGLVPPAMAVRSVAWAAAVAADMTQ